VAEERNTLQVAGSPGSAALAAFDTSVFDPAREAVGRRERGKRLCARGSDHTLRRGLSTSPLDVRKSRRRSALQYIENSALALRAAHYALALEPRDPKFLLFPMIHIGSSDYYAQVRARLKGCDLILFEGVRTFSGQMLSLAYRLVARRKRLNLVVQNAALPLSGLAPRLICADFSSAEFLENWSSFPWHLRLMLVLVPRYLARISISRQPENRLANISAQKTYSPVRTFSYVR